MRDFNEASFDRAFTELASGIRWQEDPSYYPRYRTRYATMLRRFADWAPTRGVDVLDIGGGQLAYLAVALWGDQGCVADHEESCFADLRARGIDTFQWDLALEEPPTDRRFDAIFFSEVIEHLPIPGHIALRRLRMLLRPRGLLLCSTPNLYRLRNVVYLFRGRPLFDHFDLPGERGYGHVLEYSAEHLAWSFSELVSLTARSSYEPSRTRRTRYSTGCFPRSALRYAGSRAIGTTCSPWRPSRPADGLVQRSRRVRRTSIGRRCGRCGSRFRPRSGR